MLLDNTKADRPVRGTALFARNILLQLSDFPQTKFQNATAAHYRFQALGLEKRVLQKAARQSTKRYPLCLLLIADTHIKEVFLVFDEDIG